MSSTPCHFAFIVSRSCDHKRIDSSNVRISFKNVQMYEQRNSSTILSAAFVSVTNATRRCIENLSSQTRFARASQRTNVFLYRPWQNSQTTACVSTLTHMISIISNDQLRFSKCFGCPMPFIDPIDDVVQKSVSNAWDIRKSEKKCWFRLGGAHIDVITLERKAYFVWELKDVWCSLQVFQLRSMWAILHAADCALKLQPRFFFIVGSHSASRTTPKSIKKRTTKTYKS